MDAILLAEGVTKGDARAVSRLITLLENRDSVGAAALQRLRPPGQGAAIIGVTGYPGAGKSTLIDQLTLAYRRQSKKVAILAIDTTSPLTGGALLGDRIRMQGHSLDRGVFIRSMATRGHHGGVAEFTRETVRVLEAAGYDMIFIETVGVGQDEVEVAELVQTVLAVVTPGLGDEVQAMKAGLLEVADVIVVNKGDREGAEQTLHDLQEWNPKVLRTVAIKSQGILELVEAIAEHQRIVAIQGRAHPT